MSADAVHPEPESTEDETLARHKRIAEVLDGKRPMDWSDWASFIYDSKCLTPEGKRAALWAVDILRHALKDDFFQRVADVSAHMRETDPDLAPYSHPIFSYGLWPINDLPWVYANLIRLAAHIHLFHLDNKNRSRLNLAHNKVRLVLKTLHDNPEPIAWVSALLQLEMAGLSLKAGWQVQFEPMHHTGKKSDVLLSNGSDHLLVETTLMRMSVAERKALAISRHISLQLYDLGWRYGIRISGSLSSAALENAEKRTQWFRDIEEAARTTAQDGLSRPVPGPGEALLTVFRPTEAAADERWGIEVDSSVEARRLDRLKAVLQDKNRQAEGSATPVWVRLEESAGLWQIIQSQGWTLTQTLDFFTDFLQRALTSFPHLAGVLLSPGVLWVGNIPPDSFVERVEHNGSIALRCPIPVYHAREAIIVPRAGAPDTDTKVFAG